MRFDQQEFESDETSGAELSEVAYWQTRARLLEARLSSLRATLAQVLETVPLSRLQTIFDLPELPDDLATIAVAPIESAIGSEAGNSDNLFEETFVEPTREALSDSPANEASVSQQLRFPAPGNSLSQSFDSSLSPDVTQPDKVAILTNSHGINIRLAGTHYPGIRETAFTAPENGSAKYSEPAFLSSPQSILTPATGDAACPGIEGQINLPQPDAAVEGKLIVTGWAVSLTGDIRRIEVFLNYNFIGVADYGILRPDIQAVRPDLKTLLCGFDGEFDVSAYLATLPSGPLDLQVRLTDSTSQVRELTQTLSYQRILHTNPQVHFVRELFTETDKNSAEFVPQSKEQLHSSQTEVKAIAFYLPQYHPIPENDQWWGKGFTEWANVTRAIPRFRGHYQPRLPADFGFYDLRLADVQQQQIELASQYGIYGFCYYIYWFNGQRLLEMPTERLLNRTDWNTPFCLCWANENWSRRWDGSENELLISQKHSPKDDLAFIKAMEPFLRDPRYIRVNGKPVFLVYRPSLLPDPEATAARWREYCAKSGIGEIHLVACQTFGITSPDPFAFDAAVEFPPHNNHAPSISSELDVIDPSFSGYIFDYEYLVKYPRYVTSTPDYLLYPGIIPSWDNSARKQHRANIFYGSSPALYQQWLEAVCEKLITTVEPAHRLLFINAWNEWAEGAHLEPDKRYGYAYLEATRQALKKFPSRQRRVSGTM